jgi:hypothetical protein
MPDATTTTETTLHLTTEERTVVAAALRLLRSILGKEEAEELAVVKTLLDRLGAGDEPR